MGNEYDIPRIANDREMQREYRRTVWWQGEQQPSTLLRAKRCREEHNIYCPGSLFMMGKASVTHAERRRWIPHVEIGLIPGGLFPRSPDCR